MFNASYLLFVWTIFILVAGCTSDAYAFLYHQMVNFNLELIPNYHDLLITSDIHLSNKFYVIQKMGHILAFGLLYLLLITRMKRYGLSFILCGIFALFTEVLQLYFNRNGRLFDVGVDLIGIFFAYLLCKSLSINLNASTAYETTR